MLLFSLSNVNLSCPHFVTVYSVPKRYKVSRLSSFGSTKQFFIHPSIRPRLCNVYRTCDHNNAMTCWKVLENLGKFLLFVIVVLLLKMKLIYRYKFQILFTVNWPKSFCDFYKLNLDSKCKICKCYWSHVFCLKSIESSV